MQDLIVALGLVLVIEGVLWALFPGYLTAMLEAARELPEPVMRLIGLAAAIIGALVVWFIRG